jgi:hypothetical protein
MDDDGTSTCGEDEPETHFTTKRITSKTVQPDEFRRPRVAEYIFELLGENVHKFKRSTLTAAIDGLKFSPVIDRDEYAELVYLLYMNHCIYARIGKDGTLAYALRYVKEAVAEGEGDPESCDDEEEAVESQDKRQRTEESESEQDPVVSDKYTRTAEGFENIFD